MSEERYIRNIGAISALEQARLREGHVFLAGLGGLGGRVLEHLLRAGVGRITAADGDVFEESNLNRQLLSETGNIGLSKAGAALDYAGRVNPETAFSAIGRRLDAAGFSAALKGADAAVDALDSLEDRRLLAAACAQAGIPLVHAAVGGWCGQVGLILPGMAEAWLDGIAPEGGKACLSPVCGVCAAIQSAETIKLLLGRPSELAGKLLIMDLMNEEWKTIDLF